MISLRVSPNTRFPSRCVISSIILSMDSDKKKELGVGLEVNHTRYRMLCWSWCHLYDVFHSRSTSFVLGGMKTRASVHSWTGMSPQVPVLQVPLPLHLLIGQSPQSLDQNLSLLYLCFNFSTLLSKTRTRTSSTVSRLLIVLRVKGVQGKHQAIYMVCVKMIH